VTPDIARWWSLLGGDDAVVEVRTLAGGGSGSAVHRLVTDRGRPFVLKVGTASRELRFYRELAPRVPVRVPRFVGGAERDGVCCVLLEPAGTAVRPVGRWVDLAAQLGRLHREPPDWPWAKPVHVATSAEIASAGRAWAELGQAALVAGLLPLVGRLGEALGALPACLCHGDWHLGNLLDDGGDVVWIDWQDTGVGHGPEDLALLWQRAERDGWNPPRQAMLAAYAQARGIPDDAVLRRAAVAAELMLLLLSWPAHLAVAPPPARNRMVSRLKRLGQCICGE
jgi:hypothetical protein